MAALGAVRRALLYGIIVGALAFAATPSGALPAASPAPAVTVRSLLQAGGRGGAEALLQSVRPGQFCRWHPKHRLCLQLVTLPRLCDRRPDHRLCAQAADDG